VCSSDLKLLAEPLPEAPAGDGQSQKNAAAVMQDELPLADRRKIFARLTVLLETGSCQAPDFLSQNRQTLEKILPPGSLPGIVDALGAYNFEKALSLMRAGEGETDER
jgi:hypothetical protein